jgi:hypothetical protein
LDIQNREKTARKIKAENEKRASSYLINYIKIGAKSAIFGCPKQHYSPI